MELRYTTRYTYPNGKPRRFWGCRNFPECKGTHGAHPDGTPMGIPADEETKKWRVKAHDVLTDIANKYGLSRNEQYSMIQGLMHMSPSEAHISNFNTEQCQKLIRLLQTT